jgi:multidrug efflux pump subunit AcrB
MQIALISENASRDKIKAYAEQLQDRLETLTQLKNVDIHGLPEQQVRIELNLEKMAQMHIPLSAITGSIQSEGANIPGGSVDAGNKTFNIKTSGNYTSLDQISNTIIYGAAGKNIYLKDVAKVYYGYDDEKYITRLNGHRAVFVTAALKDGENISMAQKAYKPVVAAFKKTLPANIDLVQHFDQADNVNKRLGGLGEDFLIAILLVAVTLLPLGRRPSIIVMISIPLSLAIGIVLLHLFG